jgi:hypothetical protein
MSSALTLAVPAKALTGAGVAHLRRDLLIVFHKYIRSLAIVEGLRTASSRAAFDVAASGVKDPQAEASDFVVRDGDRALRRGRRRLDDAFVEPYRREGFRILCGGLVSSSQRFVSAFSAESRHRVARTSEVRKGLSLIS